VTAVDRLLEKHDFRPRQAFKTEAGKHNMPNRDEQFKNIERLKKEYHSLGNPVMSMDVKKELIGNFYRPGWIYMTEPVRVNDHDKDVVSVTEADKKERARSGSAVRKVIKVRTVAALQLLSCTLSKEVLTDCCTDLSIKLCGPHMLPDG
jgi:hypothetical protein